MGLAACLIASLRCLCCAISCTITPPPPHLSPALPVHRFAGLAQALLLLLTDSAQRQRLQAAARQTALRFTPDAVLTQLEALLYSLTACSAELLQLRQAAVADIQMACTWASEACARPPAAAAPTTATAATAAAAAAAIALQRHMLLPAAS